MKYTCTQDAYCCSTCIETPFGDATVVPIQTFIASVLPPIPSTVDFDDLVCKLGQHRGPAKQVLAKNGRLWGYSVNTPSRLRATRAFMPLQICADRVARETTSVAQTFSFHDGHRRSSTTRDSTLPDAYFQSSEDRCSETSRSWHSFAVPGVYQQDATRATVEHVSKTHQRKHEIMY